MSNYYDFLKDPNKRKAFFFARKVQELNDVTHDQVWLIMTSALGVYRHNEYFPEILRSFWTTLCIMYGIEPGDAVYDCVFDRLFNIYRSNGMELDGKYMEEYLLGDDADPDADED